MEFKMKFLKCICVVLFLFIQDMSPNENIIFIKNFRDQTKLF